ncbi:MAG TPA: alpha/beta hydrolase [Lapillicoccus sp.]|nr:alpha/beta hydrolase [Lapillicoccus sp.]
MTALQPTDERTEDDAVPPLSLAARWGGTGHLADLGPDLPTVHYVDFGGPDVDGDGTHTPVVLVHGLGGSHLNWVLLAPQLRGYGRVYAVDLAGFGLTRGGERESTLTANVSLLATFLRTIVGEPVTLIGNSMGGMASLLLTAAHPDLVARLVLLDPSIPTRRRDADRQVAATFFVYGIPRVGEAFVRRINERSDRQRVMDTTNLCFADPTRADPEVLDAGVELLAYRRANVPEAPRAYLAAARSILRVLQRGRTYAALLRGLDVPVLLVHGERDRLVPVAAARSAAAENPTWTVHIVPDLGHAPMLEKPQLVADLVGDWLPAHPTGR